MFAQFAAGGDSAQKAFFQVVQKIQSLNDPLKQAEIGVGLFGTQFEDLGAGVFPILQSMQGELTSTAGALDGINAVKYDNAADAMNGLKRTVEANLLPLAGKASDAFKQFAQDATKALQDGFQPDDIAVIVDSFKDNLLSLLDMADKMMPTISAAISEIMRELVSIVELVNDDWARVRYDGHVGFVSRKFLDAVAPVPDQPENEGGESAVKAVRILHRITTKDGQTFDIDGDFTVTVVVVDDETGSEL